MYDPRQQQYGAYPIQQLGYSYPQPGQVGYTQTPMQYIPQGQQTIQQSQTRPLIQAPEQVYDIRARHITSSEEIALGEIPMDGSMPLFVLADKSAIIGKYWDKDAQLKTVRFVPEIIQEPSKETRAPTVQTVIDPDISNRLIRLEQLIDRCVQAVESIPTGNTQTRSSKKVTDNA